MRQGIYLFIHLLIYVFIYLLIYLFIYCFPKILQINSTIVDKFNKLKNVKIYYTRKDNRNSLYNVSKEGIQTPLPVSEMLENAH